MKTLLRILVICGIVLFVMMLEVFLPVSAVKVEARRFLALLSWVLAGPLILGIIVYSVARQYRKGMARA
jgi:hypothetical protein